MLTELDETEIMVITHVLRSFLGLCEELDVTVGPTTKEAIEDLLKKLERKNVN